MVYTMISFAHLAPLHRDTLEQIDVARLMIDKYPKVEVSLLDNSTALTWLGFPIRAHVYRCSICHQAREDC